MGRRFPDWGRQSAAGKFWDFFHGQPVEKAVAPDDVGSAQAALADQFLELGCRRRAELLIVDAVVPEHGVG